MTHRVKLQGGDYMTELKPCPFCGGEAVYIGTMKKIKIHFKNGDSLIINGKLEFLKIYFQDLVNEKIGDKAHFVWLEEEADKPYAMFNVYEVVCIEEVTEYE